MTKCAQYKDLINIPTKDNGEDLVVVQQIVSDIKCEYEKDDMVGYLGEDMLVRRSIAEKLKQASVELKNDFPEYQYKLVYAYRHPDVQKRYFDIQIEKNKAMGVSDDKIVAKAHMLVASPDVAGHPTGGAIDITITTKDGDLDMGTRIADFSDKEKINTFFDGLTTEQKVNRMILRKYLLKQGFAPFDFEWWHFSYGDRDWAFYYEKSCAIYNQIKIKQIEVSQ